MALTQPVASTVTAVIVAGVCVVILSTTGQTVAIERAVLERIDDAGTRTIVIEDTEGRAGLDAETVARVAGLAGVEWVLGLGGARDVRPIGLEGGSPVPIRSYMGILPASITTSEWDPRPGVSLAGIDAIRTLGFATAAGPVQGTGVDQPSIGVVGWLRAEAPLEFLNSGVITVAERDEQVVRIIVLATSAERASALAVAATAVLDPVDPGSVVVQTSEVLVDVRAAVQGELGTWGRNIVMLVLGAGLTLTALNVFGGVTARRRDFGRRRALGASRLDIIGLITAQTFVTAFVGAVIGNLIGTIVIHQVLGTTPDVRFGVAVAILATLAAAIAAVAPAAVAAYRDPVRILRVP